jgi:hypothetical protein
VFDFAERRPRSTIADRRGASETAEVLLSRQNRIPEQLAGQLLWAIFGVGTMSEGSHPSNSKWLASGDEDNPFDCKVLDCRHFTDTMASYTSDPQVVANFFGLRNARSEELVGQAPVDALDVEGNFSIACPAPPSNGPLFIAPEMEHKWNIYAQEAKIYVRRSWTGQIIHVADVEWLSSGRLAIRSFTSGKEYVFELTDYARAQLHFLLSTYVGRRFLPFPIPTWQENEDTGILTLAAFSAYGRAARFGCLVSDYRLD